MASQVGAGTGKALVAELTDFISRLVSLVPKPRVNLTRFHGVFAPNSKYRAMVTPARRGKRKKCHSVNELDQTPAEKRASMAWAKRLKRVFNIDVETCSECGGDVSIIACIEDPVVIQKILTHLEHTASSELRNIRCKICGILTHWEPLDPEPGDRHGVNLRNFEPTLLESVVVRRFDGADTWTFLE